MAEMKKIALLRVLSVLAAPALLAACSNTHSDFQCKAQEGKPCTSISVADQIIATSKAVEDDARNAHRYRKPPTHALFYSDEGAPNGLTSQTKTQDIWVYPYVSPNKILVGGHFITFIVQQSTWKPDALEVFPRR